MNKLREFFSKFFSQFLTFWGSLNTPKKAALAGSILVLLIGGITLLTANRHDPYEYLVTGISPEDATAITTLLKKNGSIDYLIDDKGLKVPPEKIPQLRLALAQEGLPAHGSIGWEKFDNRDFTMTEFEQNINKQRAIQGELQRTIMAIDGITSARVHIVAPSKSLFAEDQKDTTAAIYIKTKRGFALDSKQIKGIVHLASRSVEGLKPDNIVITDAEGNLLTKIESSDPSSRLTKEMMEYKRGMEKEMENCIRQIVGRIVGPDRVEAKVDVTVDFTQEEQTISQVDPDKSGIVSQVRTNSKMNGSGLNPTGIPGSKSNVPGEQEKVNLAQNSVGNSQESETTNYELPKTLSKKVLPVGNITRISAAVLVDGKQAYQMDGAKVQFEARTPEEMKQLEDVVKSTIGFKESRDTVSVQNMMFQLDPFQVEALNSKKKESREYISTLAISSAVALAMVFFFAFIVRPYFRWLAYDPERKKKEAMIEEFKPDLEVSAGANVQVKEDVPFEKLSPNEQVMYLAKHDPKRTTEAVRMLLNPHQVAH